MSDIKPTDIVIPVAVYNDMQKKIEHLNADTRRKGKALAKALKQLDELKPEPLQKLFQHLEEATVELGFVFDLLGTLPMDGPIVMARSMSMDDIEKNMERSSAVFDAAPEDGIWHELNTSVCSAFDILVEMYGPCGPGPAWFPEADGGE